METRASGLAAMIAKWRSVLSRQTGDELEPTDDDAELEEALAESAASWGDWAPDWLLDGFEVRTYAMPDKPHLSEEGPGHLVANLVRAHPPQRRRAVLAIHGWNEYFFQRHLAEFWEDLGYDFYAVDLHRYGRSLQDGELPGYMEAVEDYYDELDACVELIKADHAQVLVYAHSTGGLTASLYVADRPHTFVGLILNSPWIDMQGSALFRALTPLVIRGLAVASPTMVLPTGENDLHGRTLHQAYHGEWNYDLRLKRIESQPLRPGWTRAVVVAHDRIGTGLKIDCPILVGLSGRSSDPKEWCEDAWTSDIVLDVERVATRVHLLGWHTSLVRIDGAIHDLLLSRAPVRARFFEEIRRWELSYVRGKAAQARVLAELD
ncbi:MAG: alpha/beta hydrolase [Propionibacteriaceae bacterium]|jgi:alpha-beta hydrolase superfamily lysophospholipase|nr:alpha/beta hydrolase [Propionibacteriaceae bacterium]